MVNIAFCQKNIYVWFMKNLFRLSCYITPRIQRITYTTYRDFGENSKWEIELRKQKKSKNVLKTAEIGFLFLGGAGNSFFPRFYFVSFQKCIHFPQIQINLLSFKDKISSTFPHLPGLDAEVLIGFTSDIFAEWLSRTKIQWIIMPCSFRNITKCRMIFYYVLRCVWE